MSRPESLTGNPEFSEHKKRNIIAEIRLHHKELIKGRDAETFDDDPFSIIQRALLGSILHNNFIF